MEQATMGRVTVAARIENVVDLYNAKKGLVGEDEVHRLEVTDALVDTGSTYLAMPKSLIQKLGFDEPFAKQECRTTRGEATANIYGPVRLTILGRFCNVDIAEIAEGCSVFIGQVPLELLDFIVDSKEQRLVGNPQHGGQQMLELY
jgi:predicted aspartyl protease